jgi:hypothetical protein
MAVWFTGVVTRCNLTNHVTFVIITDLGSILNLACIQPKVITFSDIPQFPSVQSIYRLCIETGHKTEKQTKASIIIFLTKHYFGKYK